MCLLQELTSRAGLLKGYWSIELQVEDVALLILSAIVYITLETNKIITLI